MAEQLPAQTIGDTLWSQASSEVDRDKSLLLAYQAGRADAANELLGAAEYDVHDKAQSIISESMGFVEGGDEA